MTAPLLEAGPNRAIFFRSRARSDAGEDSDFDVMVVEEQLPNKFGEMVRLNRVLRPTAKFSMKRREQTLSPLHSRLSDLGVAFRKTHKVGSLMEFPRALVSSGLAAIAADVG